tara:strand:- start:1448 stop:1885 length:438 start_codon:yes stop_codon:yes gene_type:complete
VLPLVLFAETSSSTAVIMSPVMVVVVTFGLYQRVLLLSSLKLFLVVVLDLLVVAAVTVLAWAVAAVVTLLRCSTLTATTLLPTALRILFALDLLADVPVVVAATVEEVVVSMDVLRLFSEVDWEPSVCKVDPMLVTDVPTLATLV